MALSGRLYTVSFSNVTVAAAQDLFAIYSGVKVLGIHSIALGAINTTVANLRLRMRYLPATVTAGSGGSTPTPRPQVVGDAAATATAHANDTTQASSAGAYDLWDDVWNTINGYYSVPTIGGRPFVIGPSAAFVCSLDTAPASLVCNGTLTFEELP